MSKKNSEGKSKTFLIETTYDQFGSGKYLVYFTRADDPSKQKHFMSFDSRNPDSATRYAKFLEEVLNKEQEVRASS